MTITRGLSQALFSFLPDQTADLEGGGWQVTNWADARFVAVDDDVVRREVARARPCCGRRRIVGHPVRPVCGGWKPAGALP